MEGSRDGGQQGWRDGWQPQSAGIHSAGEPDPEEGGSHPRLGSSAKSEVFKAL